MSGAVSFLPVVSYAVQPKIKAESGYPAVYTRASLRFIPSTRLRNLIPCGTIKGGASTLVVSTKVWSSWRFSSMLVSIFLLCLSSTSVRSITTKASYGMLAFAELVDLCGHCEIALSQAVYLVPPRRSLDSSPKV